MPFSEPKTVAGELKWRIVDVKHKGKSQVERHVVPTVVCPGDDEKTPIRVLNGHDWTQNCNCGPEIENLPYGIVKVCHRDTQSRNNSAN